MPSFSGIRVLLSESPVILTWFGRAQVAAVIVGMESAAQVEQNLRIAEAFTPMTDEERLVFFGVSTCLIPKDIGTMTQWFYTATDNSLQPV